MIDFEDSDRVLAGRVNLLLRNCFGRRGRAVDKGDHQLLVWNFDNNHYKGTVVLMKATEKVSLQIRGDDLITSDFEVKGKYKRLVTLNGKIGQLTLRMQAPIKYMDISKCRETEKEPHVLAFMQLLHEIQVIDDSLSTL